MRLANHYDGPAQTLRVTFPGDLLSTHIAEIRSAILELINGKEASWNRLEMDLCAAKMIDSMGLNLLVSIIRILSGRGCKVSARLAHPVVHRLFLFTRLDRHLEIVWVP